ncbi:MAG: S41 family peptidase [Oscillospiraceae bacterium]|nr:S41 family peptidase [Oscillospiraceae bacterium]
MNLRVPLGAAIAFALVVAALTFSITLNHAREDYNARASSLREREAANDKFAEIDRQVRQRFHGEINGQQLMDSVARGYMAGIGDPNAAYMTAEEFARRNTNVVGGTVGIGALLEIHPNGYLLVREVYPESPAQAEGMQPGDLIVKIDDEVLHPENIDELYDMIDDAVGTRIMLTYRRDGEDFIADITRREVVHPTVFASMIPDTEIGYIIITEFSERTSIQFNRELGRLQNLGVQALIFDLRDNRGGIMRQATRVLDRLVPAGPLLTAVYRDGTVQEIDSSDANQLDVQMVVLTNPNTSGAAELFAKVLRDYGMGSVVGSATAGRGAMQEDIKLSDGSVISITVALYRSPGGISWDGVGVRPDFEVAMPPDLEAIRRELDHESDPQLNKAVSVAQGILIEAQSAQ